MSRPPEPGGRIGDLLRDPAGTLTAIAGHLLDLAERWAPAAVPALTLALAAVLLGRWWLGRWRHARMATDARLVTLLAPPEVDPAGAHTLWTNLTGLLRPAWRRLLHGQPHLVFEYTWTGPTLHITIWVPGVIPPGLVERAVQAAWPGAHTTTQPAPAIPGRAPELAVAGGALRLARPDVLPLRTEYDTDPLRPLLGAAAGLTHHQHARVQILARPVTGRRLARARRTATRLRTRTTTRPVGMLLDAITPHPARRRATHRPSWHTLADPEHAAQTRAVAAKLAQPHWDVAVRYQVTSPHHAGSKGLVRGRAHALASAFTAYSGHNWWRRRRLYRPHTTMHRRQLARGDLLSVTELAALAHLPADPAVPGLSRAGARATPPAPSIPAPGPTRPWVKPLGRADTGEHRQVGLTVADARHHLHVLGATGAGKSTLLARMILADITAGRATIVIDPKGDLITDILDRLPNTAHQRLTLIDPEARHLPTLNVLDTGHNPAMAADHIVGTFARVFAGYWGPRTDDVFRSAVLTLTRAAAILPEPPTLADIPRLLTDHPWRTQLLRAAPADPVLAGFWSGYHDTTDAGRATTIAPLMNKLRAFLLRDFVNQTVAAGPSTINIPALLDHGGVLLARLPKGALGEDTTRLLGSLLVTRVWQATLQRANQPEHARPDTTMFLDEAHNFLHVPYAVEDMLAEARAYRLSLVLAHQHLAQLPRDLRDALATNARNKITFTVSPADARELERHTTPQLTAHDLAHLDRYHAAAQLLVDAQPTPAFTITTEPLPPPVRGQATRLRRRTPPPAAPTGATTPAPPHGQAVGVSPMDPRPRPARNPEGSS